MTNEFQINIEVWYINLFRKRVFSVFYGTICSIFSENLEVLAIIIWRDNLASWCRFNVRFPLDTRSQHTNHRKQGGNDARGERVNCKADSHAGGIPTPFTQPTQTPDRTEQKKHPPKHKVTTTRGVTFPSGPYFQVAKPDGNFWVPKPLIHQHTHPKSHTSTHPLPSWQARQSPATKTKPQQMRSEYHQWYSGSYTRFASPKTMPKGLPVQLQRYLNQVLLHNTPGNHIIEAA